MSPSPLHITGVGLVTCLGRTADHTWDALLGGRHLTDHTRVERAGSPGLSRVAALAVEAATEAVAQAGWKPGTDAAIVACTSKGPVEDWMRFPTSDNVGGGVAPHLTIDGFGMSNIAAAVARACRLATEPPRLTLSAACAGGLQALGRATLLIRSGEAKRVLVVAAEASVHELFLAGFRRLGVLPPPGELCRPFDRARTGFLMSEAAAAVCLECEPPAAPLATVHRFATGADAVSLTGSDPSADTLVRLLTAVSVNRPFDLVHAHGTGTELNDATELKAFERALVDGGAGASLYSHKAALGHTLGASGLVSVVLTTLSHRHQIVPPNINTQAPMPTAMAISPTPATRPIRTSVITAAGFGGGVSAVSLQSP